MNDYMRLVAHAAAKYTGKPAVLSPLLDSYCGWENKKSRFSSEPAKNDTRIILSVIGLSVEELEVEYDGCLKVCMQHGSKILGENNLKWSRDCTYNYAINAALAPLLSAYWTDDGFLLIQARDIDFSLAKESEVENIQKFKLIPIDLINVLEPAMNVPFLKQILKAVKKKSNDVFSYVTAATEVAEANDVLSLLTCIPLTDKKMDLDFEYQDPEDKEAVHSSQEESLEEKSQTDSEDQSPKKSSTSTKRGPRQTRKTTKSK